MKTAKVLGLTLPELMLAQAGGHRMNDGFADPEAALVLSKLWPLMARLVRHALNRGNVLEGPLRDRIADGGNPGCPGAGRPPS
jgi:hypothetical protein